MIRSLLLTVILLLVFTCLVSCSGGNGTLTSPSQNEKAAVSEPTSSTALMGLWQFSADEATGAVDLVQLRTADKMLNVLGFMEPPPLTLMDLDWPNLVIDFVNSKIDVGVKLTHPLGSDPTFTGFDVRGVCFGPKVTNADGLTIAMSPEFFAGVPFGYQDGLLGAPDSVGNYSGLAGYKYYCDGLGATTDLATFFTSPANLTNRGKFSGTTPHQRDYNLDWNGVSQGFLVFNYAIYANYDFPVPDGSSLDNFSITTANSAEAFCAKVTETANSLYFASGFGGGGAISLDIDVWDWQGDISNVTVSSLVAGVIPDTPVAANGPGAVAHSYNYLATDVAGSPTTTGDLDILVTVTDAKTFGEAWFLGLLSAGNSKFDTQVYNCFVHTATVIECPPAGVTTIDPDGGWAGQTITNADITGSFINGPSLAAKLTKTGQSDIVGTSVAFVSSTAITATFNLTGAVSGDWDVVVTNGCGVNGTLAAGFEVKSCAALTCPANPVTTMIGSNRLYNYPPQPVRTTNQRVVAALNGYDLTTIDVTGTTYYDFVYNNPSYYIYETCITSTDKVIYQDGRSYTQLYSAQYGSGGFTAVGTTWGIAIPAGYNVYRLTIDGADNPIALCRNTSNSALMRVYHWDGSTWGSGVDVPASVMTEAGSNYSYVQDFAYDSGTGYYYVTERFDTHGVFAFNSGGVAWQDTNIWTPGPSSTSWETGIFIDYSTPDCRLICMSGINSFTQTTYWARYNPVGGGKTTSTTSGGTYGTFFSTFQGEGCIQYNTSLGYRFMASVAGGNVWSSTPITNW